MLKMIKKNCAQIFVPFYKRHKYLGTNKNRIKLRSSINRMKRKKKNKNSLHVKLGVSQKLLAGYLGIGRSSITMSESGLRGLPYTGSTCKGPMQRIFDTLDSYPPPDTVQQMADMETNMLKKHLKVVIDSCNVKLARWKLQLKQLRDYYATASNTLKLSGIMLAQLPDEETEDSERQRIYLNLMESNAMVRINKYGQAAQKKLQLQIEVVTFELEAARKLLNEIVH